MADAGYMFEYVDRSVKPHPARWVNAGTVELEFLVNVSVLITLCVDESEESEALERSRVGRSLEEEITDRGVSAFDFDKVELVSRYVPAKGR